MSFSNQDRINLVTKSLVAGVLDGNSLSQWYETLFPFTFMVESGKVLTQLDTIRQHPASTILEAQNNVALHLQGIVADYSSLNTAIRLTEVTDSNKTTWAAYSVHGDTTSPMLDNWIQPQLVPQATGNPSNGYGILLWDGDPSAGGELLSTTIYMTGVGASRSVAWFWNYSNGLLLISEMFIAARPAFDPYITGFRYIGTSIGSVSTDIDILTTEIEQLKASFDLFKVEIETQVLALKNIVEGITVTSLGSGVELGQMGGVGEIELKTLKGGDHVSITEANGEVTITVEGGSRTGMITRFVRGG
jgi:hypothetical protein